MTGAIIVVVVSLGYLIAFGFYVSHKVKKQKEEQQKAEADRLEKNAKRREQLERLEAVGFPMTEQNSKLLEAAKSYRFCHNEKALFEFELAREQNPDSGAPYSVCLADGCIFPKFREGELKPIEASTLQNGPFEVEVSSYIGTFRDVRKKNASVVGRAVVGGAMAGGVGAVVGAASAASTNASGGKVIVKSGDMSHYTVTMWGAPIKKMRISQKVTNKFGELKGGLSVFYKFLGSAGTITTYEFPTCAEESRGLRIMMEHEAEELVKYINKAYEFFSNSDQESIE